MARLFFILSLPFIAAPGAGPVAAYLILGALACVIGWLLFGPGGRWL